jgi:general secretion pathway protein K
MRLRIADPDSIGTGRGFRISSETILCRPRRNKRASPGKKWGTRPVCNPKSAICPDGVGIRNPQCGGILLLVLWLTAALSFVGLSLALAARTELSTTRYRIEAEQARFLAQGALEQALFAMKTGLPGPDGRPLYDPEKGYMQFEFQTGEARVTFRPEGSLLNVNGAAPEQLRTLLQAAGADERQAAEITAAVIDWRAPRASDVPTAFDRYYASLAPPYRAAHGFFTRLEQLLLVKGMTPELFYGVMERDDEGRLVRRGGLNRLLTAQGAFGQPSLNDSPYEVLLVAPGMRPEQARAIVEGRRRRPDPQNAERLGVRRRYKRLQDLPVILAEKTAESVTLFGNYDMVRLEATAHVRGSSTLASIRAVYARDLAAPGFYRLVDWDEQATGEEAFDLTQAEEMGPEK